MARKVEQYAVRSFFFGGAFSEFGRCVKLYFLRLINSFILTMKCDVFSNRIEHLPINEVIIRILYFISAIGIALVKFIFLIAFGSLHLLMILIISLISLILYIIGKSLYQFIHIFRKISYTCPVCQRKYKRVVYYCPKCGAPHHYLYPNKYGFFTHKCTCGEKIPTFNMFKKHLTISCPTCNHILHNGVIQSTIFPVFGGRSSGKTCFINSALTELEELAPKINFDFSYFYEELGDERRKFKDFMSKGNLPDSTHDNSLVFYNFMFSPKNAIIKNHVSVCDISGEVFQRREEIGNQVGYRYADSIFFIVDPLSITDFREKSIEEGFSINEYNISPNKISDIASAMIVSIKEMYRNKKIKPNLIIVFTKADFGKMKTFFSDEKINQIKKNQKINENQKAFDLLAEQFFHEFSEINTLNILKNYFKDIHFFRCSSLGDEFESKKKISSYGASDPLLFAMCNAYSNMNTNKVGL